MYTHICLFLKTIPNDVIATKINVIQYNLLGKNKINHFDGNLLFAKYEIKR